jgi:hypothetical protein
MRRIKGPGAVTSKPAVVIASGPEGYFTSGDPGGSVPATVVPDWWLTQQQEELLAFLTAAGITPDATGADMAQVLAAARVLFGGTGSLTNPGWMRLPGGLIIQWGKGTTTGTSGVTITFPFAFPNACFTFQPTDEADAAGSVSIAVAMGGRPISRFAGEARHADGTSGGFYWMALGW